MFRQLLNASHTTKPSIWKVARLRTQAGLCGSISALLGKCWGGVLVFYSDVEEEIGAKVLKIEEGEIKSLLGSTIRGLTFS